MKWVAGILFFLMGLTILFSFKPENRKKSNFRTYLGCSSSGYGYMTPQEFKALMQYPLCVKDSSGQTYKVQRFEIVYCETGLYQDSTGLPIVVTDYSFGRFDSDKISDDWQERFQKDAYKGDTIKIENVMIRYEDKKVNVPNVMVVLRE